MNIRLLSVPFFLLLGATLSAASIEEAKKLFADKRVPEARSMLEELNKQGPEDAELRFQLGRCQLATQQWDEGIASLEKAMALAPTRLDIKAEYGIGCLNLAGAKTSLTYAKTGRRTLEEVIEKDPDNLVAHEGLAAFFSNAPWIVGGSMEKAEIHAQAIAKQNPGRSLALLVGMKNKEKKYDEAFALCESKLKADPTNYSALFEFGRTSSISKLRGAEGLKALEKCLTLEPVKGSPGYAAVHYRMALLCIALGEKAQAKEHIDIGLKLSPNDRQLQVALKKLDTAS